jgi:ankyrin repeat protein
MKKLPVTLSPSSINAWHDVVRELKSKSPPFFGPLETFGYFNDFERCLNEFFRQIVVKDDLSNLGPEALFDLLMALDMKPDLAGQALERWDFKQARTFVWEADMAMSKARMCKHAGKENEAKQHYQRALRLLDQAETLRSPLDSPLMRGSCNLNLGNLDEALAIFNAELKKKPDSITLLEWRAAVYKALGDKTNAGRDSRRARKLEKISFQKQLDSTQYDDPIGASLLDACANNDLATVQKLLKSGASIESIDCSKLKNMTPLLVALKNGHEDLAEFLISQGANVEARAHDRTTALHFACRSGLKKIVEMLIARGADVNYHKDCSAESPLYCAADSNDFEIFQILIAHGANPHFKSENRTLLFHSNDARITSFLIESGLDVNHRDNNQCTALLHRTQYKHPRDLLNAAIVALVENGADVNVQDSMGRSPLFNVADECDGQTIELLLKHGADVNLQAKYSGGPLHWACRAGNLDVVKILLVHGADIEADISHPTSKFDAGEKPLHIAAKYGQVHVIQHLIDHGASIESPTKNGSTPLHVAATFDQLNAAECLIERGAKIDSLTSRRRTPLHFASEKGNQEMVRLLLERGAEIDKKDEEGLTPLDIADSFKIRKLFAADKEWSSRITVAEGVVAELEKLNFFKYVDSSSLDEIRIQLIDTFLERRVLSVRAKSKKANGSRDLRYYQTDAQDLADGSIAKTFVSLKTVFEREGVHIKTCKDEIFGDAYQVLINGKPYLVFDSYSLKGSNTWTQAYFRFIEIANDLLIDQGSDARVYAQNYVGHETGVLILTEELVNFISTLEIDKLWMPCTVMELRNKNVNIRAF